MMLIKTASPPVKTHQNCSQRHFIWLMLIEVVRGIASFCLLIAKASSAVELSRFLSVSDLDRL